MKTDNRTEIIQGLVSAFNHNPKLNKKRSLVVLDGGRFILNRQDKMAAREDWMLQGTGKFSGLEFIFNIKQENSTNNDAEYIKPIAKSAAESLFEVVGPKELENYLGMR